MSSEHIRVRHGTPGVNKPVEPGSYSTYVIDPVEPGEEHTLITASPEAVKAAEAVLGDKLDEEGFTRDDEWLLIANQLLLMNQEGWEPEPPGEL